MLDSGGAGETQRTVEDLIESPACGLIQIAI
jgi:hypothetical protein